MGKKLCAMVLSLVLAATSTFATVSAADFSDVTAAYDWASEAIDQLSDAGIVTGYPDGTFKPGNSVSKQESIALFARMMGSTEDINSAILEFATDTYADEFEHLDTFANKEMSYLIYKHALAVSDIPTYLNNSVMDAPTKRYEAATLIAKCLGGDVWLKGNPTIEVSFPDKDQIPDNALGYVQYATNLGIIKGMDDGTFNPNGDVTRAQMAVMLQRMIDLMNFTYEKGNVSEIHTGYSTVTLKLADGTSKTVNIVTDVAINVNGEKSPMNLLEPGMECVLTYSDGRLYSLDALDIAPDSEITGKYVSYSRVDNVSTIRVAPLDGSSSDAESYTVSEDAVIQMDGQTVSISSFKAGDQLTLTIKNGKVVEIAGKTKTGTLDNCVVESISFDPVVAITVRTSDNEVLTYEVLSSATIQRNNATATFSDLAVGDRVSLTLEYEKIRHVSATGTSKVLEGSIEEIVINKTPSIKINKDGNTETYAIGQDVEITLNGEAATIYDLRLGYNVKVSLTSDTVREITVQAVTAPLQMTGEITLVNAAYGMIRVNVTDSNGNVQNEQIFIKDSAKILDSTDNNKFKDIDDLKAGMMVSCTGAENIGVFEATSVVIVAVANSNS